MREDLSHQWKCDWNEIELHVLVRSPSLMACLRCPEEPLDGPDRPALGMGAGGRGAARPALLVFLPLNADAEAVRFLFILSTSDPKENVTVSSSPAGNHFALAYVISV
jgi:hypothetical protein